MEQIKRIGYNEEAIRGIYFYKCTGGYNEYILVHDDTSTVDMVKHAVKVGVMEIYVHHTIDKLIVSKGEMLSEHVSSYYIIGEIDKEVNNQLAETCNWPNSQIDKEFDKLINNLQATTEKNNKVLSTVQDEAPYGGDKI